LKKWNIKKRKAKEIQERAQQKNLFFAVRSAFMGRERNEALKVAKQIVKPKEKVR